MRREKLRALARTVAFLLPLFCACFWLSRWNERLAFAARPEIPAGTRIVFLGDSHVVDSLDPGRIGGAFNFASDGESYIHNFYKLRWLVERVPSLRAVVLPVDVHSFSSYRANRMPVTPEWARYVDYLEIGRLRGQWPHFARELLALRLFGFRGEYRRFWQQGLLRRSRPPAADIDRGFKPRAGFFIKKGRSERGRRRARRQLQGVELFSTDMVLYFNRILGLARERGLQVVLVRFPVTPEYLREAGTLVAVDDFYARVRRLAGPGVPFIDRHQALQRPPGRFFRDAQHLNLDGAERFSDLIRSDLERLGLIKPQETDKKWQ